MTGRIVRVATGYVVALVPTIVVYFLLNAGESLAVPLVYSTIVVTTASARLFLSPGRPSRALLGLETAVQLLGAAAIIISLNLTPSSAYMAWFRLVQDGEASGVLSYMFSLKVCFFSTAAATAVLKRNPIATMLVALSVTLLILYAIFQSADLFVGSLAAAVAAAFVAVWTGAGGTARRAVTLFQLGAVAALAAYPLSRTSPGVFNPLVSVVPEPAITGLVVGVYPEFPFLYNMPGYGHQLGESDIGGRPTLTERPVFSVTGRAGETVYLRTAVYELYTGRGWVQRTSRSTGAGTRGDVFTMDDPSGYDDPLRVEVLIDFFSSVPHTLDTRAINFYRGDFPPLRFGNFDAGFLFEVPVVSETVFYLDRGKPELPDNPTNLGGYLQLPDDIPAEVRTLAGQLAGDDALETAENIKRFLATNYLYSLNTSKPASGRDPAWHFLLVDGRGYCVQFATAFALLARLNGIPARYVSGFLVNIPYDSDTAVVPGYASHAWVEIWSPKSGWTVAEATPPMRPEFYDDPTYYETYNPFGNSYTGRQLELIMGDRIAPRPPRLGRTEKSVDPLSVVAAVFGSGGAAALVWFLLTSSRAPGSRRRKLRLAARRLLRRSYRVGATDPARTGWSGWGESIRDEAPEAARSVEVLHRGFFSDDPVSREDIRRVREACGALPRWWAVLFTRRARVG